MGVDAAASDRLPWLADEVPETRTLVRRRGILFAAATAAVAAAAAGGFWIGLRSIDHKSFGHVGRGVESTTVRLPPARSVNAPGVRMPIGGDVRIASPPQVRPIPMRDVRIAPPIHRRPTRAIAPTQEPKKVKSQQSSSDGRSAGAAQARSTDLPHAVAVEPFVIPPPWNPRVVTGAAGRLVQVGAFGSITQAKHGWWFMVRENPAMSHLPSVVRPARNSRGRTFYRFQVGTTSQAHSEVLCQRMRKIALSCAVVGLPWKAKVER